MRQRKKERRIAKGLVAGMIGGLAGSWTMSQFQSGMQTVKNSWQKSGPDRQRESSGQPEQQAGNEVEDDATMKTADRISMLVAHRHLSKEEKKKAGPIVHYVYGALIGAIYGSMAELVPMVTAGRGTGYGAAAWLAGDEIAVSKLGLAGPPKQYPIPVHANALASHLVYGLATDAVRRGVRAAI